MNYLTIKICDGPLCKGQERTLGKFGKNSTTKDGLQGWCKVCMNKANTEYCKSPKGKEARRNVYQKYGKSPEGKRARQKANQRWCRSPKGKETLRRASRKMLYGLTQEKWDVLLEKQKGLCALCMKPMDKPCVDHDHKTEKVRGLLHNYCNTFIGLIENNPGILESANRYLLVT